jgi:dynein heavy chain
MINTLVDTQPKEGGGSSGKSPEAEIQEKIRNEMIKEIPENWNFLELMSNLDKMKNKNLGATGLSVPLNVFLKQELERF